MTVIRILRHATWDYVPNGRGQRINQKGLLAAINLGRDLVNAGTYFDGGIYASSYRRAQETAIQVGRSPNFTVLSELDELEFPGEFPTAREYTEFVLKSYITTVRQRVDELERLIKQFKGDQNILMISHRVLMIALYLKLQTGKIGPDDFGAVDFEPLCGFEIGLTNGKVVTLVPMRN